MKTILLVLAVSFSFSSFAFETKDVECPAFAESNKRETKVVKEKTKAETTKSTKAYQD